MAALQAIHINLYSFGCCILGLELALDSNLLMVKIAQVNVMSGA
jgi:hypothetical protein